MQLIGKTIIARGGVKGTIAKVQQRPNGRILFLIDGRCYHEDKVRIV